MSQKPILQARYMSENHQLVVIAADSPNKLAAFALLGLDGDSLHPIWRVPVEKLEQRSSGHIAQITVTPYELGTWSKSEVDASSNRSDREPSCNITAIEYDAQNNTLIVALRSGRVVRLSYETVVPSGKSISTIDELAASNPVHHGTATADDARQEISLSVLFSVSERSLIISAHLRMTHNIPSCVAYRLIFTIKVRQAESLITKVSEIWFT